MINSKSVDMLKLINLVKSKSKHSDYQLLHPNIMSLVSNSDYQPNGKSESERQEYMDRNLDVDGMRVLDIGANTGYFTLSAIDSGASHVTSQEGNHEHAEFISISSRCLGLDDKIEVKPYYFDFKEEDLKTGDVDLILCLNILHHMGDDFGNAELSMEAAKVEMINALNFLSEKTNYCWMQLGFNWKGNRNLPMFKNGTKRELIEFVKYGIHGKWIIERIAVFNPSSKCYEDAADQNMLRFDNIGEFLNRPLFLLKSV